MFDALDLPAYRNDQTIRIDQEKFVASFYRRFAEDATLAHTYQIDIYDVHEEPPKVSINLSTFDMSAWFSIRSQQTRIALF